MILRAVDKELSLCTDYSKGHGKICHEWIDHTHPDILLLHIEQILGSRQDLCVEGAGAVYYSRKYWLEFLDERLRTLGNNILQENLFVILSLCEMIALSRVCSIAHLSVCLSLRWLAEDSHKLAKNNWSVRSMGQCIDILENALKNWE